MHIRLTMWDWVLVKSWHGTPLTPKFESPFQVLLTTNTAVQMQEKGWTHITRIKGPVPPLDDKLDPAVSPSHSSKWVAIQSPTDLKVTFKKQLKAS